MDKTKTDNTVDLAVKKVAQVEKEISRWQSKAKSLEGSLAISRQEGENLSKKRNPLVVRAKANGDDAAQRELDQLTEKMFSQSTDLSDLQLAAAQIGAKIINLEADRDDAIRWKTWSEFLVLARQRMELAEKVQKAFESIVPLIESHLATGRDMSTLAVVMGHDTAGNEHAINGAMNIQDFAWSQMRFLGEARPIPSHRRGVSLTDMEKISIERVSHLENRGRKVA